MASACVALYQGLDESSMALTLQLQLDDITAIFDQAKGKARAEDIDDQELAFETLRADLEAANQTLEDYKMSRSIATAIQSDYVLLSEESAAHETALRDRELAHELEGQSNTDHTASKHLHGSAEKLSDEYIAKLTALFVSEREGMDLLTRDESESTQAQSSAEGSRKINEKATINRVCVSCREVKKFYEVSRVPCNHEYCKDCLDELFNLSLTDESLFPPKCCRQNIPLQSVRLFLPSNTVKEFLGKSPELSTPNRTYGHDQNCGRWIAPENITEETGSCTTCGRTTCTICKKETHNGDCPADEAMQQLLDAAQESGWQRCFNCRRVVELDIGCNHMTCRCGHSFCYVCGEPWKNCGCDQWDEDRLYARAGQIFDRGQRQPREIEQIPAAADDDTELRLAEPAEQAGLAPQPIIPAAVTDRELRINEIARNLEANHDCAHTTWRYVPGPNVCEECRGLLPLYIFECPQCHTRACNRCRRNRL